MSGSANLRLCVLWESELRMAAKLMKVAHEMPDGEDRGKAYKNAYQACYVALFHVDDEAALCLMGSEKVKKRIDRVARIVKKAG